MLLFGRPQEPSEYNLHSLILVLSIFQNVFYSMASMKNIYRGKCFKSIHIKKTLLIRFNLYCVEYATVSQSFTKHSSDIYSFFKIYIGSRSSDQVSLTYQMQYFILIFTLYRISSGCLFS